MSDHGGSDPESSRASKHAAAAPPQAAAAAAAPPPATPPAPSPVAAVAAVAVAAPPAAVPPPLAVAAPPAPPPSPSPATAVAAVAAAAPVAGTAATAPPPAATATATAAAAAAAPHVLLFLVRNSVVILQPKASTGSKKGVKSLHVDMKSGTAKVVVEPPLPDDTPTVMGVAGLLTMDRGCVLVLITKAKKVCVMEHAVWKVEATQLVTHELVKSSLKELRMATLLQEAFDVQKYCTHMYFSYDEDLTQSAQRLAPAIRKGSRGGAESSSKAPQHSTLWSRADARFAWNRSLVKRLLDGGAEDFVLPLMVGYIGQLPKVELPVGGYMPGADDQGGVHGKVLRCCITLIGRLAASRAGTRWWRSGLDSQGNAAHFEEVEMRLCLEEDEDAGGGTQVEEKKTSDGTKITEKTRSEKKEADEKKVVAETKVSDEAEVTDKKVVEKKAMQKKEADEKEVVAEKKVSDETEATRKKMTERKATGRKESESPVLMDAGEKASTSTGGGDEEGSSSVAAFKAPAKVSTLSHLQVRCSVPVLWSRLPNVALPVPPVKASADSATHAKPFRQYMDQLRKVYKAVTLLHMGSSQRSAKVLESLQYTLAEQYSHESKNEVAVVVVPEGGSRSLAHLGSTSGRAELRHKMERQLQDHGFFSSMRRGGDGGCVQSSQSGVVCCSAVEVCDSVDVAQASLAEMVLEQMLRKKGLLSEGQALDDCYPNVLAAFRTLWANHATVIGDQINGLGSLASGPIRTGESRSIFQTLINVALACERHLHSLFMDARKQDAIDLMTGAYEFSSTSTELMRRKDSYTWLHMGLIFAAWSIIQTIALLLHTSAFVPKDYFLYVGLPAIAAVVMLGRVVQLGTDYLEKPQLCPELIVV